MNVEDNRGPKAPPNREPQPDSFFRKGACYERTSRAFGALHFCAEVRDHRGVGNRLALFSLKSGHRWADDSCGGSCGRSIGGDDTWVEVDARVVLP
jgi:hypothetical protein